MKIFRLVVTAIFLCMLTVSLSMLTAEAKFNKDFYYDKHYFNDDKTYVYCGGGGMGSQVFIDRSTLKVEQYEPPIYIISVDTFRFHPQYEDRAKIPERRIHWRFKYDYANRKMYKYAPGGSGAKGAKIRYEQYCKDMKIQPDPTIDWSGDWAYIDPHVYYGEGTQPPEVGEIAFALAYKLKFYGLKGYNGSDFYEAVRGVVGEIKDGV